MTEIVEQPDVLWTLLVYTAGVLGLIAFMLGVVYLLGERHSTRMGNTPYESGMVPVGSARLRFPAKFYLVAIFFVIFDLEVVFIFAWAIAARDVGWLGYTEMMVFLVILTLALAYAWRTGALEWAPKTPREERVRKMMQRNADNSRA